MVALGGLGLLCQISILLFPSFGFAFVHQQTGRYSTSGHPDDVDFSTDDSRDQEDITDARFGIQRYCSESSQKYETLVVPEVARRNVIGALVSCFFSTTVGAFNSANALSLNPNSAARDSVESRISDGAISSLVYKKILGKGGYKMVYLVEDAVSHTQWALAVEKVRSKAEAKSRLKGIRRAEELQAVLAQKRECGDCFERVERWWFQSTALPEFEPNVPVFPSEDRTQVVPKKFLGRSKWLVALKPVYDMDLERFAVKSPTLYPIGSSTTSASNSSRVVAGIDLNERDRSALRLAYGVCEAGRLMHSNRFVHRDIKPKNIMLKGTQPVIIDFGFAEFVEPRNNHRLCIEEPGKIKGETGYILSNDASLFLGCAEGDTYAMGKSLYEVIFGGAGSKEESSSSSSSSGSSSSSSSSSSSKMSLEKIKVQETKFRKLLSSDHAGTKSRFLLSEHGRGSLMLLIQGLCQKENPISFAEAADYLKKELTGLI